MELLHKYFSDFSPLQVKQFEALEPLYREWNEKINVISRKDVDSIYEKHILHSLSIAAAFDFTDDMEVLDLGTGGGFPGIPLAIFFPAVRFHLVDSIGKKIRVVESITESLGLENVSAAKGRAEEIKNKKFDMVVSRAVAPLGELWRWTKFLVKKQGLPGAPQPGLICLKGGDLAEEIQSSGTRPGQMAIREIFEENFFEEKYILYVRR